MGKKGHARGRGGRTWRRIALGVGVFVLVLGTSAAAAAIFVHTDAGHRFVARRIESAVDGQISGRLHIGAVRQVSLRGLKAHDVRFSAPNGEDVLVVDDVDLELR